MKNNMMLFFDTMLFFLKCKSTFSRGYGQKIMASLFFLHRLKLDDANFWDRIDSMVLFCGMFSTARTKMGMIRQTYNGKRRDRFLS